MRGREHPIGTPSTVAIGLASVHVLPPEQRPHQQTRESQRMNGSWPERKGTREKGTRAQSVEKL